MNNSFSIKKIAVLILTIILIVASVLSLTFLSVKAESEVNLELYSLSSNMEYYLLDKPKNCSYYDGNIAIYNEKQLHCYVDGEYKTPKSYDNISQIKFYNKYNLFILDNDLINVDLRNLTKEPTVIVSQNTTFFDFNDRYLITTFANKLYYYELNGIKVSERIEISSNVDSNKPIAINSSNDIVYVEKDTLNLHVFNLLSGIDNPIKDNVDVASMAVNGNMLYYTCQGNKNIYVLNLTSKEEQKFASPKSNYDLGEFKYPSGIAIKNNNILITDSTLNAIQEFNIDDELSFTGFAIAKNKTAFNRVGKNSVDIEKKGNIKAVLDDIKLTIFDDTNDDIFSIFFQETEIPFVPDTFALGNNTVVLANKRESSLVLFDIYTKKFIEITAPLKNSSIVDITYQNGYYYLLATNSSFETSNIYRVKDDILDGVTPLQFTLYIESDIKTNSQPSFTVDVKGNVLITTNTDILLVKPDGTQSSVTSSSSKDVKKIITDLDGKLYVLENNVIIVYNYDSSYSYTINIPSIISNDVKSFAFDIETSEMYFIFRNEELVYVTNQLDNLSISKIDLPDDFKITDKNADISTLKVYTIKDSANVYSIIKNGGNLKFEKLLENRNTDCIQLAISKTYSNFILVAVRDKDKNEFDTNGQDTFAIINIDDLILKDVKTEPTYTTSYVAVDVNMYYLPILTIKDYYPLKINDNNTRLLRGQALKNLNVVTVYDEEFYYCQVYLNNEYRFGYVPVKFTTIELTEVYNKEQYTLEQVKATILTSEEDEKFQLNDNEQVKLYYTKNDTSYIAIYRDGKWIKGTISSSFIVEKNNNMVKVAIIISLVSLALFVSSMFIIFRKRKK